MSKVKAHIQYRSATQFLKNGKGRRFPGVTTIVGILDKPALIKWANNLGLKGIDSTKFRDDKADIGTLGHAFVTDHYKKVETDTSDYTQKQIDKATNAALSYYDWEKKHKVEPILIEAPLVDEELEFGGMSDLYAKIDDKFTLVDLKTGNGIWPEHFIQVAAYKHLLEVNDYEVEDVMILNIPRAETENFISCQVKNLDLNWQIFEHCLQIYKLRKLVKG